MLAPPTAHISRSLWNDSSCNVTGSDKRHGRERGDAHPCHEIPARTLDERESPGRVTSVTCVTHVACVTHMTHPTKRRELDQTQGALTDKQDRAMLRSTRKLMPLLGSRAAASPDKKERSCRARG